MLHLAPLVSPRGGCEKLRILPGRCVLDYSVSVSLFLALGSAQFSAWRVAP